MGSLRILMVAARYFPFAGGIETHVHEVGRRLAARGHSVSVVTGDPTRRLAPRETVNGIDIIRVPTHPRQRDWCLAPRIATLVAETPRRWDVVHVQGYHTFSAPLAMIGALRARVPFVLTFHSGGHSSRLRRAIRRPQSALLAPLARRAHGLVGVSQFEADHFSKAMGIARSRFDVVPNGASLPASRAIGGRATADAGPLIVSLGRLERYKGHQRAIAAFAVLRQTVPTARLRILGEGPYEATLRGLVAKLGLNPHVEIGAVPASERAAMATILMEAALVVLLSDYEAHPIAVMEALSLGRRVVTTDTSGFIELAAAGQVRAVPLDATPAATADVFREEIVAGPRAAAATGLPDWDDCSDRLTAIYNRVIAA